MHVRIANREDPDQTAVGDAVWDPEGVHSNAPLRQNYSIFLENFWNNQVKISNNQLQLTN